MKIVFMGTPEFAVSILEKLCLRHEVICAVTQPDKPQGRKKTIIAPPVKEFAQKNSIEVLQPERIRNKDFINLFREKSKNADIFVVAAYGQILPESILNMPKHKCLNVHASLLPKYRGAAPIQWAVINGEKTTGVTIMKMDRGIDTGDIILQRELKIEENDTSVSVFNKLADLGADALLEAIEQIENGSVIYTPQNDIDATYAPMIIKENGKIEFNLPAKRIVDLIRGISQEIAAYTFFNGGEVKVWNALNSERKAEGEPGRIVEISKNSILVNAADFCLEILEVQPQSGKRMDAASFARGRGIKAGDFFSRR